jgi:UDP-N-acetylglucosamine diphosphorylase/glucosamine-1-phosphate N-acetyltransferase
MCHPGYGFIIIMKTVIYEDRVKNFLPLVYLYPQHLLRIGPSTIAEQLIAYCESTQIEYVYREYFQRKKISAQGPKTYLAACFVPLKKLPREKHDVKFMIDKAAVGFVRHKPPYPVTLDEIADVLEHVKDTRQVQGVVLEHMWDIIAHSNELITSQFTKMRAGRVPAQAYIIGDRRDVRVARSARLYRHIAIDVTDGPVYIDERAQIRPFSSIIGPAYIGQDSLLDRAKITKSSIGPQCRIGGEVEASVFQGYVNKYHEGFIGHSFVGEWVNLGALTTNSDLKNNYGPVRLEIEGKTVSTGVTKLGCFIGDHTKTGIGTLIPTGAVIGCFVNFFGGGMMPRNVPCFRWLSSEEDTDYDLDRAISTARLVMSRRGLTMSPQQESTIRHIHQCQMSS